MPAFSLTGAGSAIVRVGCSTIFTSVWLTVTLALVALVTFTKKFSSPS